MLDSSPLPIPPPKKLKRTASVASLPSPPPSVEHLKKRTTAQRFTSNGSDTDPGSDEELEGVKGKKIVGRKLLFPAGPSTSSAVDDPDNPFLDSSAPSNARDQLALDAASSPSAFRAAVPSSPPPSRRGKMAKTSAAPPKTPPPVDKRGRCSPSELPVLDEENNPFLSDSPPKLRRPRSPRDLAEQPTMTYVFKGVKTSFPNPSYNLPDSAYETSRLPLSDPSYSPPPTRTPKRLFLEAYQSADDVEDEDEDEDEDEGSRSKPADADLPTPDTKPRMSKLFVDGAGNPLPDSGPQGIRGKTMDANEIGRMAVGPIRGRG